MKKHIQHGDISFHKVENFNGFNLEEIKHNGIFVVAEGEITGHQHRIVGDFKIFRDERGELYLQTGNSVVIEHWDSRSGNLAEHKTKEFLPNSFYFVEHEKRYNPFIEELESVID